MEIKKLNPTETMMDELFPDNLAICAYRGSIVHNMYVPNTDPNSVDDIDMIGMYLAPKEYYVGLGIDRKYSKAIEKFIGKYDVVSYEFRKLVRMLLKSNPNVISLLWLNDEHYINLNERVDKVRDLLRENRTVFSSMKSYGAFCGYADGQLKKMEAYSKEGYMGEKRASLVEKFGYDVKNAAHCIRLLRMGIEFLETGVYNVARTHDREELLDIKLGNWPIEEVKKKAQSLFDKSKRAAKLSSLPEEPDYKAAEELMMDVLIPYVNG